MKKGRNDSFHHQILWESGRKNGRFSFSSTVSKTFGAGEDHVVKQTPFRADGLWRFEKLADGTWRILNPADGRALSAHGEDAVALDEWQDLPGQRWEVLSAPAHLTM